MDTNTLEAQPAPELVQPITPPIIQQNVETAVPPTLEALQIGETSSPLQRFLRGLMRVLFRIFLLSTLSIISFYYVTHATFESERLLEIQTKLLGARKQAEKVIAKKITPAEVPMKIIPKVEESDNAFLILQKIRGVIQFTAESNATLTTLFKIGTGEVWDEALARDYVDKNKETLQLFKDASNKKSYQDPVYSNISKQTVSDLKTDLTLIKNISTLSNINFQLALRDGNYQVAKEILLEKLSFTNLMLGARGEQQSSIQASSLKTQVLLQLLPSLTLKQTLTSEDSLAWEKVLSSYATPPNSYSLFLEVEADKFKANSELAVDDVMKEQSDPKAKDVVTEAAALSYADFLTVNKSYTDELAKSCSVMSDISIRKVLETTQVKTGPNADLETFFSEQVSTVFEGVLTDLYRKCHDELALSSAKVLIALKAYKDVSGDLPNSLEELVPNYLTTLPLDPYSDAPLKYSKEKGYIYSIGVDKKDEGGNSDLAVNWQTMNDPTFGLVR